MPAKLFPFASINDVSESEWIELSEKRIYFGHQSVGFNIVEGINDVMKVNPQIKLNIIETSEATNFGSPIFAHSAIGKNMHPISKMNHFNKIMRDGLGDRTDIAFFKFCYVDISHNTDIEVLFNAYKKTMLHLKEVYPKTTFIHFTVPLTAKQGGIKAFVKKIIGRPLSGVDDNISRNHFNQLMSKEYGGKEPIFELAGIESTFPDGKQEVYEKDGKYFPAMVPDYTYDGGHLNDRGRKIMAEQLLVLLSELSD